MIAEGYASLSEEWIEKLVSPDKVVIGTRTSNWYHFFPHRAGLDRSTGEGKKRTAENIPAPFVDGSYRNRFAIAAIIRGVGEALGTCCLFSIVRTQRDVGGERRDGECT